MNTSVEVDNDVVIVDSLRKSASFSPISVIEHQGNVSGTSVSGHYTADILDHSTNQWYRTSDSSLPRAISKEAVGRRSYIFLYKKQSS